MPTYFCMDCGVDFKHEGRGRIPKRCDPCTKKHNRNYMRDYMREKYKREKMLKDLMNPRFVEEVNKERVGELPWDHDSIPHYSDIFSNHSHDSGHGIDKGCFAD